MSAHLGIPYAAPPAGERRWAPPEPTDRPPGDGAAFGPAAPQPDRPIGLWFHGPTPRTDEDCLSLNVWAPEGASADAPRPVFVWLHGGGWALGFSGSPIFDGAALAEAGDMVVVTLNYRLGSLGWLHHPDLAAAPGDPIGNWGLQDQAAALRWVRDHIADYGGDPGRVTLAGQSAGAGSVLHLLASPLGDGLFQRAIAQSPPLGELTVPAERGVAWTEALRAELGGDARAASADAVVAAHEALLATPQFRGTRGGAMPIPEPATLPQDPRAVPAARLEVPVLIGTAADEGTFLFRAAGRRLDPDDERLRAMVAHLPDVGDEATADALIAGEDGDNNTILCRLATRQLFAEPVAEWAAARAAAGGRVHRYRVDHPSVEGDLGAVHTIEISLVFGTYRQEIGARVAGDTPAASALSEEMTAAWRDFVHGEDPWDPAETAVFGRSAIPR